MQVELYPLGLVDTRVVNGVFLKFSISLLAILAATVCNLELRVVKSVPEEEKRTVTRAMMTKRAIRISIRENPSFARGSELRKGEPACLRRKLDGWVDR